MAIHPTEIHEWLARIALMIEKFSAATQRKVLAAVPTQAATETR